MAMIARLLLHPLNYLLISAIGVSIFWHLDSLTPNTPPSGPHQASTPAKGTKPTNSPAGATTATPNTAPPTSSVLFSQALAFNEDCDPAECVHLAQALADLGPGGIETIARTFSQARSPLGKRACSDALALIGSSEAIDHYVALVMAAADDPQTLDILATSLVALSNQQGIETLASALPLIDHPTASAIIAEHTGRLATAETAAFLLEMWDEPASTTTQHDNLALAIGNLSQAEAAEPLIRAVNDMGDAQLQSATASALARIGTPAAIDSLVSLILRQEPQPSAHRQALLQQLAQVANPEAKHQLQSLAAAPLLPNDLRQAAKAALHVLEARG